MAGKKTGRTASLKGAGSAEPPLAAVEREKIVLLNPSGIEPQPIADRWPRAEADEATFVEMIREHGQLNPIIVRKHPSNRRRYVLIAGSRRLNAARSLKIKVRAIVRTLTEVDAIVAQGVENAARNDLSYIERAVFAMTLEKAGVDRSTIMSALCIDKSSLSRLAMVANTIDRKIIEAIGSAPTIGRTRWMDFAEKLQAPGMIDRAEALIVLRDFERRSSDARFSMILEAVAHPGTKPFTRPISVGDAQLTIGSMTFSGKSAVFRLGSASPAGFADFLASRIEALYAEFNEQRQATSSTRRHLQPRTKA